MSLKNQIPTITYSGKNFLPGFFIYLNKLDFYATFHFYPLTLEQVTLNNLFFTQSVLLPPRRKGKINFGGILYGKQSSFFP